LLPLLPLLPLRESLGDFDLRRLGEADLRRLGEADLRCLDVVYFLGDLRPPFFGDAERLRRAIILFIYKKFYKNKNKMSKNRLGIYSNVDLSKLNQPDSIVNSTGLFDGCEIVLYTSEDLNQAVVLNTSDPTEPKLVKQSITEDKKDNARFKFISSNGGYLIRSVIGDWYLVPNPNTNFIYGSKNTSAVWLISNLGGKSKLTSKLRILTKDRSESFMAEKGNDIIVSPNDSNNQWILGIAKFGEKAFEKVLPGNTVFEKMCCDDKGVASVCKSSGFVSGSSKCSKLGPQFDAGYYDEGDYDMDYYDEDDFDDDYDEGDFDDDYDEGDFDDDYDEGDFDDDYDEGDFDDDGERADIGKNKLKNDNLSDALNITGMSKLMYISLILALVILIIFLGLFEFKFRKKN
jgi:hypothetical protein